jgi:hypothetical protein
MVDAGDVKSLVAAVNAGKKALEVGAGGAFLINEHGRVLVPASDGAAPRVVSVGMCSGPLRFSNPFEPGSSFDLYDDRGLESGSAWDRPYIGLRHNLSAAGELYFWHQDSSGAEMLYPPGQDAALVGAIRSLRPYGPVRFLVGPGGLAITKVPPSWEAHYVGRVNLSTWFDKEV